MSILRRERPISIGRLAVTLKSRMEALERPLEERAEALRSAVVASVEQPIKNSTDAFRRSWAIANQLSDTPDVIPVLQYIAYNGSIGHENHNGNHDHYILATDGTPRHGRLATISIVGPLSSDQKPEFHEHNPEEEIELNILVDGSLASAVEGSVPQTIHRLLPTETSGRHTVINPSKRPALYLCLRYKIDPNEPQE